MCCLFLFLYLVPLSASALASLPAPFNLSVNSVNFHHVLHWSPRPGTPPGAQYTVFKRVYGGEVQQQSSATTSLKLQLENYFMYHLTVQAHYNNTFSPVSNKYTFCPYRDTKIGPPKVSLAGCGNCIQINMSLPEADTSAGIDDILKFYNAHFKVLCKKGDNIVGSYSTPSKSFTIDNLNMGEDYCVEVDTEIVSNKNTVPSSVKCIFTSTVGPRTAPILLVAGGALVIFFVSTLISIMFCLHYTGFLCKLKTLPIVIIVVGQNNTLTPEHTTPDPVTIVQDKQNMPREPTVPHHVIRNEDEDEEEDDTQINYLDRAAPSSTGESLPFDSGNSKSCDPAGSADCGRLTEGLSAEVEASVAQSDVRVAHGAVGEGEVEAEEAILSKEGHIRLQGHVTGGEEEEHMRKAMVFDNSGNVDLFSVTLVAMSLGEEDGEESAEEPLSDSLKQSDLEPLLTVQKWTREDSQSQSDDETVAGLVQHIYDFTGTGNEGVGCNTSCYIKMQHGEEHSEEENDDRIFPYMAHT